MTTTPAIHLGTRGSALALRQCAEVRRALRQQWPSVRLTWDVIRSTGDDLTEGGVWRVDSTGVFTTTLTFGLLGGGIDAAVHSCKDLPIAPVPGVTVCAVLKRLDARDVLVARDGRTLSELPAGAVVGTSSRRRRAMVLARRPDLRVTEIRGNVPRRLELVASGVVDAVVLARAGLLRLGRAESATEIFPIADWLPAPGQGAIAVEVRATDRAALALVDRINDPASQLTVSAERALFASVGAGCHASVGAYASIDEASRLTLSAVALDIDGRTSIRADGTAVATSLAESERLGHSVAQSLLARGALALVMPPGQEPHDSTH